MVIVVGAGLVGLATALRLLEARPGIGVTVLDKEPGVAAHQSGHNSGVIHRGITYRPGSLKAELCVQGVADTEAFAAAHGIPVNRCGKLIVAATPAERERLDDLLERGTANGVVGLEIVGPERIREIEPHCVGLAALHSPGSAIVDFGLLAQALRDEVRRLGGEVRLGAEVAGIEERPDRVLVRAGRDELSAESLVACAGLQSDRLADLGGVRRPEGVRIVPFRGDYFLLRPERTDWCRGLIYPVPDPELPFLGVHLTRRVDGEVWLGPNAVLAFAREGYRPGAVSPRDMVSLFAFGGFWRMGMRYWRLGLSEMWRASRRSSFLGALRRYLPELEPEDLVPGPAGVRAQAVSARGTLVDDFVFAESARQLHVLNAPSPAATSALAIGRRLAGRVLAGLAG
ncbi:MAG TPA: L-2-hydroxyglutarate oxidase [Candidatus Limnocylindrales bacterium]